MKGYFLLGLLYLVLYDDFNTLLSLLEPKVMKFSTGV